MQDFKATFQYTNNADFPNTQAVNSSGGTAKNGTHFNKSLVDENWGFMQAVLSEAGLTPSGVPEVAGSSQVLDGIIAVANAQLTTSGSFVADIFPVAEPGNKVTETFYWTATRDMLFLTIDLAISIPAITGTNTSIAVDYVSGDLPPEQRDASNSSTIALSYGPSGSQNSVSGFFKESTAHTFRIQRVTDTGAEAGFDTGDIIVIPKTVITMMRA